MLANFTGTADDKFHRQSPCHLILKQVSPDVCGLVGAAAAAAGGNDGAGGVSTTLRPPPGPTSIVTANEESRHRRRRAVSNPTTPAADKSGDQNGKVPSDGSTDSGGGAVGIILAILTLISLAGAGCFMLLRNPERRDQLRSLFGRGTYWCSIRGSVPATKRLVC
nr:uncharacterized protein LOC115256748 [Aedes albopictus]